jgi:hypothetical protein
MIFVMFFLIVGFAEGQAISLSIRYYDMRIYYLNRDPIRVQVTLTNNSPHPFRFKLADERVFSLDFDVRTTTNRPVEPADVLVRRRTTSQQVFFREVLIEPGESFSFIEDLRDYARLDTSGAYVVQARIYPELYRSEVSWSWDPYSQSYLSTERVLSSSAGVLMSNRLSLNIRPPLIYGPDGVPLPLDVETNAILVRERMPPDEVISYMLRARQREQWERYFLYMDLEAMLARDPYRRRQFQAESEEGRQRMVDRYRMELQNSLTNDEISDIPMSFNIERTVYNADEGTVTVLEFFRFGNYTERKRFTYHLQRRDGIWTIVDYSVVNLGTE